MISQTAAATLSMFFLIVGVILGFIGGYDRGIYHERRKGGDNK